MTSLFARKFSTMETYWINFCHWWVLGFCGGPLKLSLFLCVFDTISAFFHLSFPTGRYLTFCFSFGFLDWYCSNHFVLISFFDVCNSSFTGSFWLMRLWVSYIFSSLSPSSSSAVLILLDISHGYIYFGYIYFSRFDLWSGIHNVNDIPQLTWTMYSDIDTFIFYKHLLLILSSDFTWTLIYVAIISCIKYRIFRKVSCITWHPNIVSQCLMYFLSCFCWNKCFPTTLHSNQILAMTWSLVTPCNAGSLSLITYG